MSWVDGAGKVELRLHCVKDCNWTAGELWVRASIGCWKPVEGLRFLMQH